MSTRKRIKNSWFAASLPAIGPNTELFSPTFRSYRLFRNTGLVIAPDENFARELMQLFSIGLLKLNEDGTPLLDPTTGDPLRTYDSKDSKSYYSTECSCKRQTRSRRCLNFLSVATVMSMARAWTGFDTQYKRANVESLSSPNWNLIDPLRIIAENRDRFPKSLFGGYIGDGYPLCSDLPGQAFLKIGAKYRLLGSSPKPEMVEENPAWASLPGVNRLRLQQEESGLYELLCAPKADGSCTFPGVVTLESNLVCSEQSTAAECMVDTVNVVQVGDVYFEHIRQPCVELAFYNNARAVTYDRPWKTPTCANPDLPVAGAVCCDKVYERRRFNGEPTCKYAGERVTLKTAEDRCEARGMEVCDFNNMTTNVDCPHANYMFNWRTDDCFIKAKITADGAVSIYHESAIGLPERQVRNETVSFFDVVWESESHPTVSNNCGDGLCKREGKTCFCDTTVQDNLVFPSPPAGAAEILEKLKIGHLGPALFSSGKYESRQQGDYVYHSSDGTCCGLATVFEVIDRNGVTKFFRNIHSTVKIVGTDDLKFRNPPQFNSVLSPQYSIADAEHETDAVLQQLFYHPNTAPFLAVQFIKRFGISNPSPRYVRTVAKGTST